MSQVEVTINSRYIKDKLDARIPVANRLMLEQIQRLSRPRTPLAETSQLRGQVSKKVIGTHGIIQWMVPYASYQERGMRYDGSHVVRKYTTPGTGKDFAKQAVVRVIKDADRYYQLLEKM